jgi:hypothetical protein
MNIASAYFYLQVQQVLLAERAGFSLGGSAGRLNQPRIFQFPKLEVPAIQR